MAKSPYTGSRLSMSASGNGCSLVEGLNQRAMMTTRIGIAVLDQDFNYLHINQDFADLGGYGDVHLSGTNHFDRFPDEKTQAIFEQVLSSGKPYRGSGCLFGGQDGLTSGNTHWDWLLEPAYGGDGRVSGLVLSLMEKTSPKLRSEIQMGGRRTGRIRSNQKMLREQAASLQLLKEITQAAYEAKSIVQAFQYALDRICRYTGWPVGHAFIQWGDLVLSSGLWHLDDLERYAPFQRDTERRSFGRDRGMIGRVFAIGEAIWIPDLAADPSFIRAKAALECGLRAGFAFPVWAGQQTVGVFEFFTPEAGQPRSQLNEIMRQVGAQLGQVMERELARQELEQSREQLHSSVESMIDAFVILGAVRDERSRIVDFTYTYANEAACRANHITREQLLGMRLLDLLPDHRSSGLFDAFCQVVETGEPLIRDGFEYEYHWEGRKEIRALDMRGTRLSDGLAYTWRNVTERKRIQTELTEVEHRMLESIERERLDLAHELHDGPIQDLYGADFQLHSLERGGDEAIDWTTIDDVQTTIHDVIHKLRETCGELRPTALAPFGLQKAILSHAERFQETYPEIEIQTQLDEDGETLPHSVRLGLFRIYQQLMINAARHAYATRLVIQFQLYPDRAVLRVQDNGVGFVMPDRWVELVRHGHYGLMGSLERAEALGGRFEVKSAPGQGTDSQVIIPLLHS